MVLDAAEESHRRLAPGALPNSRGGLGRGSRTAKQEAGSFLPSGEESHARLGCETRENLDADAITRRPQARVPV